MQLQERKSKVNLMLLANTGHGLPDTLTLSDSYNTQYPGKKKKKRKFFRVCIISKEAFKCKALRDCRLTGQGRCCQQGQKCTLRQGQIMWTTSNCQVNAIFLAVSLGCSLAWIRFQAARSAQLQRHKLVLTAWSSKEKRIRKSLIKLVKTLNSWLGDLFGNNGQQTFAWQVLRSLSKASKIDTFWSKQNVN